MNKWYQMLMNIQSCTHVVILKAPSHQQFSSTNPKQCSFFKRYMTYIIFAHLFAFTFPADLWTCEDHWACKTISIKISYLMNVINDVCEKWYTWRILCVYICNFYLFQAMGISLSEGAIDLILRKIAIDGSVKPRYAEPIISLSCSTTVHT